MTRALFLILALCATTANAETLGPMMAADLNGDGRVERFSLADNGRDAADLTIENTGGGVIVAQDIAWVGSLYGQKPELSLAPNGSLRITSMNEGCCRSRWSLTLTVAHRKGSYMVAGLTYIWRDTIDLENYGICDLNLLTGKGELTVGDRPKRRITTSLRAMPVARWGMMYSPPGDCF